MKSITFLTPLAMGLLLAGHHTLKADVAIEIDAGILRNATGLQVIPTGSLLQLIAIRSGASNAFTAPVPGSFTGNDPSELVVQNFSMNSAFGPGEVDFKVSFQLENTTTPSLSTKFDAGDALALRWWPGITVSGNTPSRLPTALDTYGQFFSGTGEGGGIAWFTPTDGKDLNYPAGLNFLTTETTDSNNQPGTHLPVTGYATNPVNPVPEPSTYALLGFGIGGLTFGAMQQRRRRQVAC